MRDVADVYIGSEELSGFIMWFGVMGPVCDLLNDPTYHTTFEVGEEIIRLVDECPLYPQYKVDLTMSAVRTDKMTALACRLDNLSRHLNASPGSYINGLWLARQEVFEFGEPHPESVGAVDLLDFVLKYAALETDPVILNDLSAVETAFAEAVIADCHGSNMEGTHGLSIYYPRSLDLYDHSYETSLLDFSADTCWDLFLCEYLSAIGSLEHVYVDDDAPASWYDLSHVNTIGQALDRVMAGGAVFVHCGVYDESIVVEKTVSLSGEGRGFTFIRSDMSYPVRISADDVLFTGFTVHDAGLNRQALLYLSDADQVTVKNCVITHSNGDGIWLADSNDCTITHNLIQECNRGVFVSGTSTGTLLHGNIFRDNTMHAQDANAEYIRSHSVEHGGSADLLCLHSLRDVRSCFQSHDNRDCELRGRARITSQTTGGILTI
ncbi:MAG: right-handed parallel beta-helix repeat-containing protein [Planctomycetota bacterium]